MPKTKGLSPKVILQLVASAIAYVLAHYSVGLDPDLAASIAGACGFLAGVQAKPGDVVIPPTQAELEAAQADARAGVVPSGPAPVPPPVMPIPPGSPPA